MSTTISRLYNWATDKTNSVKITASRMDAEMNQVITALNRKVLCAATAPADPINGQTWVDTDNNLVKAYLNNAWVIIANYIYIQSATPEGMSEGYLWYDTANNALKSYDGSSWSLVNPSPVPSGSVILWAGTIAGIPSGYLLCDGSLVSKTTYATLYGLLGTIHGAGDASNFNLPDLRDRFIVGAKQDDSGVPKTNVTGSLTQSGDGSIPAHTHDILGYTGGTANQQRVMQADAGAIGPNTITGTAAVQNAGTGTKNIATYYALAYIIKT